MNIFFSHDNEKHPPSISELGEVKPAVKSDSIDCLEQLVLPGWRAPHVDVNALNGANVTHILKHLVRAFINIFFFPMLHYS